MQDTSHNVKGKVAIIVSFYSYEVFQLLRHLSHHFSSKFAIFLILMISVTFFQPKYNFSPDLAAANLYSERIALFYCRDQIFEIISPGLAILMYFW